MTTYGFQDQSSQFTQKDLGMAPPAATGLAHTLDNFSNARQMRLLVDHYPELSNDPAALVGILQGGGDDEQMFLRASQTVSMADMATTADNLKESDPDTQRAKWANFDQGRRAALTQLGYAPPPVHEEHDSGWTFGIAGHDIATVGGEGIMGAVTSPISFATDAAAGFLDRTVKGMGEVADFLPHVVRTVEAQTRRPGMDRGEAAEWGHLFDMGEWGRSWHRTDDGNHFFTAEREDEARAHLDQHPWDVDRLGPAPEPELRFQIVRSLAADDQARDYARSLGYDEDRNPENWHAAILKWNSIAADPEVQSAAEQLKNGHVTMARSLLHSAGMNEFESGPGRLASGALDAYFAFKLDPIVFLTQAHQAEQAMRYGIRIGELGEGSEDLAKSLRFAKAWDTGGSAAVKEAYMAEGGVMDSSFRQTVARAKHMSAKAEQFTLLNDHTTTAAQRLLRDSPEALLTYPTLAGWKEAQEGAVNLTKNHIYDYWESMFGKDSIVKSTGLRSHKVQMLPHLTPLQQKGLQAKGFMSDAINIMADAGQTMREAKALLPENMKLASDAFKVENIDSVDQLFLDKAVAPVGRFFKALTTHGPYKQGLLDLGNPDSAVELQRFVNMGSIVGMTEQERMGWNARLLGDFNPLTGKVTNNKGMMQATALQFLDRVMEMGGIAGEDFARRFVNRAEQMYGLAPESFTKVGGTATKTGVFSVDVAGGMAIPSPMELLQATRGQTMTKTVLGGYTASPLETWFTKAWKPLTLMHLGFIPRIAGEEMLGFALRKGPITAGRNTLARWASEYEPALEAGGGMVARQTPESLAALPVKWMSSHLMDWTAPVEGAERSGLNKLTGAFDGYVNRWAAMHHDALHAAATSIGIPDRRLILSKLVGAETLDNYYEAMNSSVLRRAMAEHASAAYWGHPDTTAAFDSVSLVTQQGGKRTVMSLPLRDDVAAQKAYIQGGKMDGAGKVREATGYADVYMNALMRKTAAPDAMVGLKNLHLTTDGQVTRIDRALTDMGYAPEVPTQMTKQQFVHRYEELEQRVLGAEKKSSPAEWTPEMRAAYDSGDFRTFSELRGYTPEEIADFDAFHQMIPGNSWEGLDMERIPYPAGSANEGDMAARVNPRDLYDRLGEIDPALIPGGATAEPLARVKAFKSHLDQHLGPQGREIAYDIADGRITAEEASAALEQGVEKASTTEQRFALRNLKNVVDNPSMKVEDYGLLTNDRLNNARLTTDRGQVTRDMAKAHEDFLYDPKNSDVVSDLIIGNYHEGLKVATPVTDGARPLYVPMVDGQSVQKLRALALDPNGRAKLRAAMVDVFEQRGLDPDAIDHILDGIASTDNFARQSHATLLKGMAIKRTDRYVPAGLWGSNDDRVADAVTDVINRVATGNRDAVLGTASVPTRFWDHAAYPDRGLHAGPGRSFLADNDLLTQTEPILAANRVILSEVKMTDGSTRWMDDGQLRRFSARKEVEMGPDGKPVILGTQQRSGTAASAAIERMSQMMAQDLLSRLAPTENGVLHSLLEPMTRGKKWAQDPQGVWNELPSHLTPDHYIAADGALMPPTVYGPEKVARQHSRWENFTNKWFEGAVQPALSAMSRNPLFVQHYAESARLARSLYGDTWVPKELGGRWADLTARLGLSAHDEQALFREFERLPRTLTDVDASTQNYAKVLGGLLGTKLHTVEEAERLAELRKGAPAATKVGVPELQGVAMGKTAPRSEEAVRKAAFEANQAANAERLDLEAKLDGSTLFHPEDMATFRNYSKARMGLEEHVSNIASQTAMQKVLPYIHDPSVRSHFQSYVGTLMPFQFAEEQFLKRWAKTFIDDPGAARKLMILHDGIRNVGFVQPDPFTGEDVFVWPGSDQINQLMSQANPIWPGAGTFRGLAYAPLSGTTSMIIPGFGEPVAPNLGPGAGLALHGITQLFPEFSPLEDVMASDRASVDRNAMEWVMPSHLNRIYEAVTGDVDKGQLASLAKNSIAYLAAHGQAPPSEGTEHDKQEWLDNVRDLSRTQLLLRGVFGLLGPSGGTTLDYHDALSDDYRAMLADGLSPDEAFSIFVAKHKGKVDPETVFPAYSVFATRTVAGAKLPQTQEAVDFVANNEDMVKAFPLAMSWLMPQSSASSPRVRQAYSQQLRAGLRDQRTPEEFFDQILFAEGADPYFAEYEDHQARVAALPAGSSALADEQDRWRLRSTGFKAQNPVFAKILEDPTATQRRNGVRQQLDQVLGSPDLPGNVAQADALRTMMKSWHSLQDSLGALRFGRRTAAVQRQTKALPQQFIAWAHGYLQVHPEMTSFYNSVFKPDLPDEEVTPVG